MTRTVVVLTHRFDPTADRVVDELNALRVPVVRFDTAEFPASLTLEARIGPDRRWVGTIATSSRTLDIDCVAGVYHRRPTAFEVDPSLNVDERAWATLEARMGFGGVLASIGPWLNHPHRLGEAEYKPWQLRCAHRHGLWVPRSLVTNDPPAARAFVRSMDRAVYKPLAGSTVPDGRTSRLLYTTVVTADECDRTISTTAHLFQEWVPKDHEVRVTVVDDQVFAARIDTDSAAAVVDWRSDVDGLGALVTQVDGVHAEDRDGVCSGVPTSSSSAPALMRLMLDALDLRHRHRVLEIGTGTGYNAAVLARVLGSDAVTSVDVDPDLVARARTRLHAAGLDPVLAVGDGAAGHDLQAPYDRLLATVAVDRVPPAWLEQTAAGGRLVLPLDRGGGGGLLVALDVDDGRAVGRLLPDYGGFMPVRASSRASAPRLPDPTGAPARSTELEAAQAVDPAAPFEFFAALRVGGLLPVRVDLADGVQEDWVLRGDGSWACLRETTVRQGGPTRLWDILEFAHADWTALGRPPRERFGLTVDAGEHTWWLDDPDDERRCRL